MSDLTQTDVGQIFIPEQDLTVVIPTHNRSEYFLQYLEEGRWEGVRIHLVCDGCDPEVVQTLRSRTAGHNVVIFDEQPNRGVAYAIGVGVRSVRTSHFMFCGDDDYYIDYTAFLKEASRIKQTHDDVLFVTMPEIVAFGDNQAPRVQYDRRGFQGMTGRKLLEVLTYTGEMWALVAGSLFRTDEVIPVLPEPFFRVSEDFVLLARLCARYPDRLIYVAENGRRMRRIHPNSLSARVRFSPEKALMHLVAMCVAGFYMEQEQSINRAQLVRILLNRGKVLQQSYGLGLQTSAIVAGLLLDAPLQPETAEARQVLDYLKNHRDELPAEFIAMLSKTGRSTLFKESKAVSSIEFFSRCENKEPTVCFVGGAARTGTTLMETILCQAPSANPMLPEAHYLRCLMMAYCLAKGSVHYQVPGFFDSKEDFQRYHAKLIHDYLMRVHERTGKPSFLILKEPEMTKTFPDLHELVPTSLFICMVRDPRDVIASLLRVGEKMLAQGRKDFVAQATQHRDIASLSRYFLAFYAPIWSVQSDKFWANTLFVRYEDLVQNPEAVLTEVKEFTGLDFNLSASSDQLDTGMVDFKKLEHNPWFSKLYGKQISASSVGNYADVLHSDEIRTVEKYVLILCEFSSMNLQC